MSLQINKNGKNSRIYHSDVKTKYSIRCLIPYFQRTLAYIYTLVTVDPADVISDHSLVTCSLPTRRRRQPAPARQRTIRCWHKIDRQVFAQAVRESTLGSPPPSSWTADKLFTEYDRVLRDLADRFVPEHKVHSLVRPLAPWFDSDRRALRRHCRKLERRYRRTKSEHDRAAFFTALRNKHAKFADKKNRY